MFTVKQLSRLAGITPRTLHYYDQVELLKPSQVGANGYRYYGDEALLRLQQILFYRQLDMPLGKIKQILQDPAFDVQVALEGHRLELERRIAQMQRLIATVDDTLSYLEGKKEMSKRQFFEAFSDEQQAEYEKEAMQRYDPAIVKASNQKWKSYSAAEKQRIGEEGNAAYEQLLLAMPKGAASPEAQAGVESWRRHMAYFWTPNYDQLLGLAQLYNDDPRFKANFDKIDPGLADFILQAVTVYVGGRKK
jgi:MerR family transcriptional regulator, thiopeptide resistance regulator